MDILNELPRWRCHKIVEAAPIVDVGHGMELGPDGAFIKLGVDLGGGRVKTLPVKIGVFARYLPVPGDYLVVYKDGYQSIAPKAVFESGYSRIAT